MVDSALLEQVLSLDADSRRELIRAVEDSLDHDPLPETLAEVDRRLALLGSTPLTSGVSLDDFVSGVRARRSA